jgi:hypothetical protein
MRETHRREAAVGRRLAVRLSGAGLSDGELPVDKWQNIVNKGDLS